MTDDEWAFAAPYLALLRDDAGQRAHDLREVFHALRWLVKTGTHRRYIPNDFPPWPAVYQQARRWMAAGVFEAMAHDLRQVIRVAAGRHPSPIAAVLDGRTIQSTRGASAGPGTTGTSGGGGRRFTWSWTLQPRATRPARTLRMVDREGRKTACGAPAVHQISPPTTKRRNSTAIHRPGMLPGLAADVPHERDP